jgi:hypothetical protein
MLRDLCDNLYIPMVSWCRITDMNEATRCGFELNFDLDKIRDHEGIICTEPYPNPAQNTISLKFIARAKSSSARPSCELISAMGVKSADGEIISYKLEMENGRETISGEFLVDANSILSGIYYIAVKYEKFVKIYPVRILK